MEEPVFARLRIATRSVAGREKPGHLFLVLALRQRAHALPAMQRCALSLLDTTLQMFNVLL
ncbi:MAG TPA: hypothetical protein DCZ95_04705 [Verrucomicrobia bacterium]|nr:MAG: hypothetical protein A2X46_14610 [Lentisphaerae bacterium GWF2_57_35]HBA83378.1 hypothetical protein [Verrucomicrobiota bacterium]